MPLFVAPQPVAALVAEPTATTRTTRTTTRTTSPDAEVDDDQADRPANRRRRRGRRGRGRGRGEQGGADGDDSDQPAGEDKSEGADDDESDDESDGDEESTTGRGRNPPPASAPAPQVRQRRGRRGRHVRRSAQHRRARARPAQQGRARPDDAIQGISGSTRLEAKRQRRRDGRDAGRRRPPILTEAEFLARREAVERVMVVRDKIRTEPPHEGARYTQIAVLEDGVVVEHFVTSRRIGVAGRQHLPRHRAERAAVDGGRVRRHRPRPQRCALRGRGQLGGSRTRRRPAQDRAGAQARRLRRRPGQQGPGRAQGRPADHAGVAGRPLPGLRAGCVVDRDQPQAARHRASAAQGDPARGRSRRMPA